jgi:hypothetical protein
MLALSRTSCLANVSYPPPAVHSSFSASYFTSHCAVSVKLQTHSLC